MKRFFQIDYYLQLLMFIGGIILSLTGLDKNSTYILLFYAVVGLPQLASFLIRLCLPYPKSWMYKAYGWLILPVWLIILLTCLDHCHISPSFLSANATLSVPALLYMIGAFFFSPVMALLYVLDCRNRHRATSFRIQKFLQLRN